LSQVLDRILAAGHIPVLRTYNRLLHGVALNGDLATASRMYLRLRAQGIVPDEQTMRALFKCVGMYASDLRVETARKMAQAKPGDR
jgi:pentatricopeptide repeat protein